MKRCHDSDLTTYDVNFKRVNSHIRVGDNKVVREGLDTLRLVDKKSPMTASPKNNVGRKRTSASMTSRSNPAEAVTALTTTRKRPEAQSDSDEEEEISEMRVPRRKKPSTQNNGREEEEKKDDYAYNEEEMITIRKEDYDRLKKDYEDLIKERDELKEQNVEADKLCGILHGKLERAQEKLKKKREKKKK